MQEWFASRLHLMAESLAEASGNDGPDGKAPEPLPMVGFGYGKEGGGVYGCSHSYILLCWSCVPEANARETPVLPEKHQMSVLLEKCQGNASTARETPVLPGKCQCCQGNASVARETPMLPENYQCCQRNTNIACPLQAWLSPRSLHLSFLMQLTDRKFQSTVVLFGF